MELLLLVVIIVNGNFPKIFSSYIAEITYYIGHNYGKNYTMVGLVMYPFLFRINLFVLLRHIDETAHSIISIFNSGPHSRFQVSFYTLEALLESSLNNILKSAKCPLDMLRNT